ncbi:MAG: CRISPR-associated endoribonuclease Cas6 [bacterium]|jgi:CRISPR-associated endoribonuclease Cas6
MPILHYHHFCFTLLVQTPITLPKYKGSILRGGFGAKLKEVTCVATKQKDCNNCKFKRQCTYYSIFATPPTGNGLGISGSPRPHPYIIQPPQSNETEFKKGQLIQFSFLLFGDYIQNLHQIIFSFLKLGQSGLGQHRGKYSLHLVEQKVENQWKTIFHHETQHLENENTLVPLKIQKNLNSSSVNLQLLTPLRIKSKGKYLNQFNFLAFWQSLLKRAHTLVRNFESHPKLDELEDLWDKAPNIEVRSDVYWHDWERYSAQQKDTMKLGGLLGSIELKGDLSLILPLLKIGEKIHVGKNTSFGLGQYRLSCD